MPNTESTKSTADKILTRFKGLRAQMQTDEEPILALPAIWDSGSSQHSTACDVIVTNQRVIGYYYRGFPRERIFVESIDLNTLRTVTWRDKNYEPVFREIMISDGVRKIYIRTQRQKSQQLYDTIQILTEHNELQEAPEIATASNPDVDTTNPLETQTQKQGQMMQHQAPVYGREEVRRSFESSSLGMMLLIVGGILLEFLAIILLFTTHNASISLPLFIAGLIAILANYFTRRMAK
ncbi:hypothetical protein [Dictyobacter arantiisoli]|uniref:Uncharacterized protein n=1 Tax=Dictyobacter arantiisoli TaxID=2014874 RepID=A0A5A5TD04_9CHLR|nr:hypothetical protein [Dictyobacter arantiisoli]GCF08899.1 hypothetical protein KDI_24630 [Dictyobacter arantiisoli]